MNKRWIPVIVPILILMAGYGSAAEQKVVMEIKGMTCSLCTFAVKKSLSGIRGVDDVKVSYQEKKAWLTSDDSVTDFTLVEAVQNAGYKGKVIERTPLK